MFPAGAALLLASAAVAQPGRVDTGVPLRAGGPAGGAAVVAGPAAPAPGSAAGPADVDDGSSSPAFRGLSVYLTSGIRFDDNVLRVDTGAQRDAIAVMQPRVYLNGRVGRHDVRVGYEADVARFQRVTSENYFNHNFLASADLDLERRLKARLDAGLEFGSDAPGELESREVLTQEPDRWREYRLSGAATLGRRIARAEIGLRYGVRGRRYLNNAQQDRDFDERDLTLTGRYNVSPRFGILSEASGAWIDYLDPTSTLDSREFVGLLGVAWEATAKTSGEVKVGVRHLDFDSFGMPGIDGFTWDARVQWAPKTYSAFTAYTSRVVTESGFEGGSGVSSPATADTYGLRWRYGVSERLQFDAGVERTSASFSAGGEDIYTVLNAGIRYHLDRWVDTVAHWDYTSRSAESPGGDFEDHTVFVGFEVRLERGFAR